MGNVLSAPAVGLALSVGGPVAIGATIGITLAPEIKGWYLGLKKPSWNPPNWLFGPVWTVLYATMGYASWRVAQAGGAPLPLGLYAAQLLLNFAWSPIFFKLHNPKAAAIEITGLLGMLAATIVEFNKVDSTAAALMLPYLGWVSFASALTWNIFLNNTEEGKRTKRAARSAVEQVEGAASEATAKAATVFLAEGGERQSSVVPPEAAEAAAAARSKAD